MQLSSPMSPRCRSIMAFTGYCPMSSPSALWHRNILELEPVTLLRPPPTLDRIMQPRSPKNSRWVVVHDHTVVTGGWYSSHLRCFKPSWHPPQFYPVIIISFASFFVENSQRVNKAGPKKTKVFVVSYSCQFLWSRWYSTVIQAAGSPFYRHPSREAYAVGVDDSQYLLLFAKPPTRFPPLQYHKNNQDGLLTESVGMTVPSCRLRSNHGPGTLSVSSHRRLSDEQIFDRP